MKQNSLNALIILSNLLLSQGHVRSALIFLEVLYERLPEEVSVRKSLVVAYFLLRNHEKCMEIVQNSVQSRFLKDQSFFKFYEARCLFCLGKKKEGRFCLEKILVSQK